TDLQEWRGPGGLAPPPIDLALLEPDLAPNVGAVIRLGACLGLPVHVIEPCGFPFSAAAWRKQALDYAALAEIHRHASWEAFRGATDGRRLLAFTTRAPRPLAQVAFRPGDVLLFGRESAGLPEAAHAAAEERVVIPLRPGARSLNVAMAAAIAAGEAVRQLGGQA
ncbi:MAG: TrmH family RNA methyltransferase, partial [Pseudomonadota bacterium]